ncbi:MAG: YrbL family protein [Candidatus Avelusimicrobium sp.]|uniref:YrbL family protein n=1 Tax=Candidatus Avelusimicrobium sp. TaxID=3048833 RepID=UPI003F08F866
MDTFTMDELRPFLLGQGTERIVFRSPKEKDCVIKLSPLNAQKQTRREIRYFRFLQKKGVPFLHIPQFKGEVKVAGYVGFKQEAVLDADGSVSRPLTAYLAEGWGVSAGRLLPETEALLDELLCYLLHYNVLPCDLTSPNVLCQRGEDRTRLVLIDGVGSMNGIPIAQYIPFLGRQQIKRKWLRFMTRRIEPILKK